MLSKRVSLRAIVSTQDGGGEFRYVLNEQRHEGVGQAFDVTKNDDGRLPAQGHTAGRNVYEHQYDVDAEHEIEATFCDWQMGTAIKNVSSEGSDGEFRAEKSEVAVLKDAGHESITFGRDAETNPKDS